MTTTVSLVVLGLVSLAVLGLFVIFVKMYQKAGAGRGAGAHRLGRR